MLFELVVRALELLDHGRTRFQSETGATAVEYGLMLALIAAVIIAVVALLGEEVAAAFQNFIDSTPW